MNIFKDKVKLTLYEGASQRQVSPQELLGRTVNTQEKMQKMG